MSADKQLQELMIDAIDVAEKLSLSVDQAMDCVNEGELEPNSEMAIELIEQNEEFKTHMADIKDLIRKYKEKQERYGS